MSQIKISKLEKNDKKLGSLSGLSHQFVAGTISALTSDRIDVTELLFNLISGKAKPDDGSIFIDDQDAYKNRKQIQSSLSYLNTEENSSLRGSVEDSVVATLKGDNTLTREQVFSILKQLGLHLIEPVSGLDEGRLNQLRIVLTIIQEKSILLLNHPTTGMTKLQRTQIWQLLRDFTKKTNAIVIFNSESMNEMQKFADEILYFSDSKLKKVQKLITHDTVDSVVTVKGTGFPVQIAESLGIFTLQEANDEIKFIFSGNIQALLPLLEQSTITDVRIEDATIKDELMRF